ncbi:phage tail domain-containing protein [Cytobacillus sp. FSL R7-0696]|uniref:phage tail domain-containing protein n=1 Tax=Cytobacillus sp. FSL R7-0696 TaxID=2921691 RepID=UPI0030F7677B
MESSVWIDDNELQALGLTVMLDSSEPMLPSFRTNTMTVPGRHGAYDFGAYMDVRQFDLNCAFKRQSYTDLKAQIRQFVRLFVDDYGRPKTVKLRFGDEPDKYYNVKVGGGVPVERLANLGFFTLPLIAHDPMAKFIVPSNDIVMGSDVPILSDVMWETGFSGRRITMPSTFIITNEGNTSVNFSFVLEGRGDNVSITIGNQVMSLGSLSGETIQLNGDSLILTENGVSNLSRMSGQFLKLLPGRNIVRISGIGLNIMMSENITYRYV